MKITKLVFPALLLGLVATTPCLRAQDSNAPAPEQNAQPRGPHGRFSPDRIVARIDEVVGGLTDDQKSKIKDIITANMQKMRDAAPEDRRQIWREQHAQIRAVLTPDQQKKFDEMRGPRGRRHRDQ